MAKSRKLQYGNEAVIRSSNVPKRYRGRTAIVDHQFNDGRVLLYAPDRKRKLGVWIWELERS